MWITITDGIAGIEDGDINDLADIPATLAAYAEEAEEAIIAVFPAVTVVSYGWVNSNQGAHINIAGADGECLDEMRGEIQGILEAVYERGTFWRVKGETE